MNRFVMKANQFLLYDIVAYFHTDFLGADHPGNPNFLYKLKNDPHHNWSPQHLRQAVNELNQVLSSDFPKIMHNVQANPMTVCVVPRAKSENTYRSDQLLFRATIGAYARSTPGLIDGSNFIIRHTDTRTTHLRKPIAGFQNSGSEPYPGIATRTCHFAPEIKGSDIFLVDDIYTKTINIDEDMVQALFKKGARSVVFYAIGYTQKKY